MARGRPHPFLRGLVDSYAGYAEQRTTGAPNLEVPHPSLTLIVNLGEPIRVSAPGAPSSTANHDSFLAGLHDAFVVVGATGPMRCVEARPTPAGARVLLGRPLGDLANRTVDLGDLLGRDADELAERMDAAPGWAARFVLLEEVLLGRTEAWTNRDSVLWAWRQLRISDGRARRRPSRGGRLEPQAPDGPLPDGAGTAAEGRRPCPSVRCGGASDRRITPALLGGHRPPLRLRRPSAPQPGLPSVRRDYAGRLPAPPDPRGRSAGLTVRNRDSR